MSFSFGNTAKTTSGFTLGSSSVTTAVPGAGGDVTAPGLSFSPQTTQVSFQQKATGTVAPLTNAFSQGTASTQGTGFSLGLTPTVQPTGFSVGQIPSTQSTGFSLGQTQTVQPSGFSLGQTPAAQPMGFSVGTTQPTQSSGFALGQTPTAQSTGFSMGQTPAPQLSGFSQGQSTTTQSTGFSLGQTPSSQSTGLSLVQPPIQSTGFSIAATPAISTTSTSGFSMGTATQFSLPPSSTSVAAPTLQTTAPASFSFGAIPTTSAPSVAGTTATMFSTPVITTTSSLSKLPAATSSNILTTTTSLSTSVTPASSAITTTVSSSAIPAPVAAINFGQLQEIINKWKSELDEQEKQFIDQAAQVSVWDHLLITNSEKIVSLNNEVESMKLQQQQLDHELEFILSQQGELEECLTSLEKDLATVPSNADPERENIYLKAESMDTQLKQMSEDLKEIIEQLNESNRIQDISDPIVQIGRILNAHMNSLQWIDQNTVNIQTQLNNVSKVHDHQRRDSERSFRVPYD